MRLPAFRLVRHLASYLLGSFLIGWGLCVFGYELGHPEFVKGQSYFLYAPNMFCGVIVYWGASLVLITYRHYAGGVWTYLGAVLTGLSMILAAFAVDGYLMGRAHSRGNVEVAVSVMCLAAATFIVGCYSLVAGHVRHKRKHKDSPPSSTQKPIATPA